jgi:hypothetical protein
VPSLVWFTGSEDDIYVFEAAPAGKKNGTIATVLPNFAHALWGDPLLETFFLPPAPSAAVLEGYTGSGGGQLIVFPRQKTKRLWYTIFLALIVLRECSQTSESDTTASEGEVHSREWAIDLLRNSLLALKDAPCY